MGFENESIIKSHTRHLRFYISSKHLRNVFANVENYVKVSDLQKLLNKYISGSFDRRIHFFTPFQRFSTYFELWIKMIDDGVHLFLCSIDRHDFYNTPLLV